VAKEDCGRHWRVHSAVSPEPVHGDATLPRRLDGPALVYALWERREQMETAGCTAHASVGQMLRECGQEQVVLPPVASAHAAKMPVERRLGDERRKRCLVDDRGLRGRALLPGR